MEATAIAPVTAENPVGVLRSYQRQNKMLVDAFVAWLAEENQYASNSRRSYEQAAREFAVFLGARRLLQVGRFEIREYMVELVNRKLGRNTITHRVASLRTLFNFLRGSGLRPDNPANLIRCKRQPPALPRVLSESEIEAWVNAAGDARERAILETLYATGCRIAELCAIRIADINFTDRIVRLDGKGGKHRIVPFGRKALEAIERYLGGRKTGFLFAEHYAPQKGALCRKKGGSFWYAVWTDYQNDNGKLRGKRVNRYIGSLRSLPTLELACAKFKKAMAESRIPEKARLIQEEKPTTWYGKWGEYIPNGSRRPKRVLRRRYLGLDRETARLKLEKIIQGLPQRPLGSVQLQPRIVREIVYASSVRAGIGRVNPHRIRHTCATHLLRRGADLRAIQELLGHSHLSTTALYLNLELADLQKTIQSCHPRA